MLSLDSADIVVGDTLRLSAVARDAQGNPLPGVELSYTSTDPSVATVSSDGLVTAVGLGQAEIEVAIAGEASVIAEAIATEELQASVQPSRRSRARIFSVPRVEITPGETRAEIGQTVGYSAQAFNRAGVQLPIDATAWSSSDRSVATIDANGLASVVGEGTTQITVKVQRGGGARS